MMKKIRFYIGRWVMTVGLYITPIEADPSIHYNTKFLRR